MIAVGTCHNLSVRAVAAPSRPEPFMLFYSGQNIPDELVDRTPPFNTVNANINHHMTVRVIQYMLH